LVFAIKAIAQEASKKPARDLQETKQETTMPVLLWLLGVPAIVVIALLITHVI
jgi:hypothetical protein